MINNLIKAIGIGFVSAYALFGVFVNIVLVNPGFLIEQDADLLFDVTGSDVVGILRNLGGKIFPLIMSLWAILSVVIYMAIRGKGGNDETHN